MCIRDSYVPSALAQISEFDKYPEIKYGLWLPEQETQSKMDLCIDKESGNSLKKFAQQGYEAMKQFCKSPIMKSSKDKFVTTMNCKMPMVGTMKLVNTETFIKDSQGEIIKVKTSSTTSYSKPMPGMKKTETKHSTIKWSGPCKNKANKKVKKSEKVDNMNIEILSK